MKKKSTLRSKFESYLEKYGSYDQMDATKAFNPSSLYMMVQVSRLKNEYWKISNFSSNFADVVEFAEMVYFSKTVQLAEMVGKSEIVDLDERTGLVEMVD